MLRGELFGQILWRSTEAEVPSLRASWRICGDRRQEGFAINGVDVQDAGERPVNRLPARCQETEEDVQ